MRAPLTVLLFVSAVSTAALQAQPAVGDFAPRFALPYATRDTIVQKPTSLDQLLRQGAVILAFYPADWSSGCTKEVCAIRDGFSRLSDLHVTVVGISGDYVYSHQAWARQLGLGFKLMSDHAHAVAKNYGSYNEATGHDRRTVFLVTRTGTIAYEDLNYDVSDSRSYDALLAAVASLR